VSATAGTVVITEFNLTIANLGDRIINAGDTFMLWRISNLKAYQVLLGGVATSNLIDNAQNYMHGLGFIPISNTYYAAPTTSVQFFDFPEAKLSNGFQRVTISTGRQGLMGSSMFKWLTTNTTSDADQQSAGTLSVITLSSALGDSQTAGSSRGMLEGICEFRSPIDSALIPSSLRLERQKIVSNGFGMVPDRVTSFLDRVNPVPTPDPAPPGNLTPVEMKESPSVMGWLSLTAKKK